MNDIHKYKKALIHTKELAKLEKVIISALSELQNCKQYIPAQECIEVLSNNLTIVQVHLNHQRSVVENKGKI